MLLSLAIIFLVGLSAAAISERIGLPRIIGMLAVGITVSPYVLDLLDPSILGLSSELRQIALIIILVKAGLSLDLSDLKKVGRPAVLMSFVPACFEIIGYVVFAPLLLGVDRIEAAVMGAVLSAVSPAVVVPRMVKLIEDRWGTQKSIPQMILAGASCDDIFVIVLFSTFVTMAQGGTARAADFLNIPVSIVLGVLLGAAVGALLYLIFEKAFRRGHNIRSSKKVIILLGTAFLLMSIETLVKPYAAVSGLLAVVAMACVVKLKAERSVSAGLSEKFGKLWIGAEVLLFVLVGAAVDVRYTLTAGASALAMIFIALAFRAVGVCLCLIGTELNTRERAFCVIAYLPKATVQAAIGSVPMSLGLPCGKIVLSAAVLAIIITAPLGAIGIDRSYKKLLGHDVQ
ncbi:NhaP-type Na+/H+ or K+/H+ antiporter [Ruminococcus sp. YE71]|uniref:cation:proton antiporter n=1 Tax=unclassified Ruminococcus TaxID=2608920 RepID=UPI00087E5F7C|nr:MULTISPECIES: cation:proton antiporter [unclassified Ruminococcus]SDA21846.1 NhaP-type Na+/H+ or K+/H+ antiporter [Ruminococcus sp. YE78]SFW36971.1 NhaP-type Na+/H+ or K+/H+ antiporter [Ruminococcus sp. YE71]